MKRIRAVAVAVLMAVTAVGAGISRADGTEAQVSATVSTSAYVDLNGEVDTLTITESAPAATVAPSTVAFTDDCYRTTATGKLTSHLGFTLFTFTSYNVFCRNHARTKVTYYHWETPAHNVTSSGSTGGWQWSSWSHNQARLNACYISGVSVGHFVQKIPLIGQIGSADVRQQLEVTCAGHHWS